MPFFLPAEEKQTNEFKILYSASLNGNLDGCDCKFHPRAGLVKRAFYLRLITFAPVRRENLLIVDAGDIMDTEPDEPLAKAILDTYRELHYEAIVPGEQECIQGAEALLRYKKDYPLLAHNLAVCLTPDQCQFFSLEYPIYVKGGVKLGLLALLEPAVFTLTSRDIKQKFKVQDPVSVAQGAVAYFKEQGVAVILLLYHGAIAGVRELIKQVPDIDLVILGHEQYLIDGEKEGRTWLFSPGEEGNRVGEITVTYVDGKIRSVSNAWRLFSYEQDPDDAAVRQRISAYYSRRFPR